ncbi:GntR family transcriptional regulator [Streptomyces virginiae]|uniref:GntR family transcriptional regulator n=1 Tax=Streptomyces virginiae TaxID=1961 RepID=UPI0035D91D41
MGRREQPPPYMRVAADLRRRLAEGEWGAGERLPPRTQFAAEYEVGPNVLQRAQDLLILEGILEGRPGSGTYVRQPYTRLRMTRCQGRQDHDDSPVRSDPLEADQHGSWETHSQARLPAPEHIARRLDITPGDPCVRTTYELLADGRPVRLSQSWEPMPVTRATYVPPESVPPAAHGVVERLRSSGVRVQRAVEVPRPGLASQEQATLLGVNLGALVQKIERTYYDAEGRPVETADIIVPDIRGEIVYEFAADHRTPAPDS